MTLSIINSTENFNCTEDENCLLTATAIDIAGNINSTNYTINVDDEAPKVELILSDDFIESHRKNVTITATAIDQNLNTYQSQVNTVNDLQTQMLICNNSALRVGLKAGLYDQRGC